MNVHFDDLVLADIRAYIQELQNPKTVRTFCAIYDVDYVDLYCYFKWKFGKANGMQSFLRSDSSDNLYHWGYCLSYDECYFDFVYSYRQVDLIILSSKKSVELDGDEFRKEVSVILQRYRTDIEKQRNEIEAWDLFQNTYLRLKKTIDFFYSKFIDSYPEDVVVEKRVLFSEEYLKEYFEKTKKLLERTDIAKNYGLSIRMLCPVVGESFTNLVLYILGKPEVKSDKRVFENISRSNIDVRIKTMHLYCDGLVSAFNQDDIRFKDFMRLMDKRNDFLHGNVTPGFNTFDRVYFDGTVPTFPEPRDLNVEFTRQSLFQVTRKEIDSDVQTINSLVEFMLENVDKGPRKEIEYILSAREIGWNKKKNKIGVLFPPYIVDSFPGGIERKSTERNGNSPTPN